MFGEIISQGKLLVACWISNNIMIICETSGESFIRGLKDIERACGSVVNLLISSFSAASFIYWLSAV